MKKSLYQFQYDRLSALYCKLTKRLNHHFSTGRFQKFTHKKQLYLLSRLERLKRQLLSVERAIQLAGIILTLGAATYTHDANAQASPVGSEFKVNATTTNDQRQPVIAMNSDGDFVVAWNSYNQDGDGSGIYAQRFNASGAPVGAEFKVNSYTTFYQYAPSVAIDDDGDFVITWQSDKQDGQNYGVYAQRYNASGVAQGGEFKVNTYTTNFQGYPSVAMDNDGDFVIAWLSTRDGSGDGIYAQRYNSLGVAQGTEFKVNTYTTGGQEFPAVAMDADGDFVITWESENQDGDGYGIYAQRFNALGAAQGSEFKVNTSTYSYQVAASVAMDDDGDFIIAWESWDGDGDRNCIFAQRYSATGTALGTEFRVNTYTTGVQRTPSVAMDIEDNFTVTWQSYEQDGEYYGIYAQRYNSSAMKQGPEFKVNTYTTKNQESSAIAARDDGGFVVIWESRGQDDDGDGIYAQLYSVPTGNTIPSISAQAFSIAELSTSGTTVGTVLASDADAGQTLVYSILSGNTGNVFSINSNTGVITLSSALDYETLSSYNLTVLVTDNGSPSKSASANILINVTNENDIPQISTQTFTVGENSPNGTSVGTVLAADQDAAQILSYSITSGNTGNVFSINSSTGEITVNGTLDYETFPLYSMTVVVTDNGSPVKTASATIKVNVTPQNNSPSISPQTFSILENSINGTTVGTVMATETDPGQTLSYSITTGNTGNAFSINSSTGVLKVANTIDYETLSSYSLTIKVTDNGTPSATASAVITVNITNETNENTPSLLPQIFSVAENSSNGTVVGTVVASDADAGQTITYLITSGNSAGKFAINNTTGAITVAGALNYETNVSYSLTVQATDNGSPSKSKSATITINITDVIETSVYTAKDLPEISFYPNPARGQVYLTEEGIVHITIMDLSGHVLKKQTLTTNTLNLQGFSSGTYLIQIEQEDRKIIKKLILE